MIGSLLSHAMFLCDLSSASVRIVHLAFEHIASHQMLSWCNTTPSTYAHSGKPLSKGALSHMQAFGASTNIKSCLYKEGRLVQHMHQGTQAALLRKSGFSVILAYNTNIHFQC